MNLGLIFGKHSDKNTDFLEKNYTAFITFLFPRHSSILIVYLTIQWHVNDDNMLEKKLSVIQQILFFHFWHSGASHNDSKDAKKVEANSNAVVLQNIALYLWGGIVPNAHRKMHDTKKNKGPYLTASQQLIFLGNKSVRLEK